MHKAAMAVEAIVKMSKPINGKDQIARVAAISASSDEVGAMVADAMEKVTNNGVITIEESKTMKTELDLVEGMQFDRGYISAYMCTDMEKMEATLDDPYILITDKKISSIQEILPLLEEIVKERRQASDHCRRRGRRSTDDPDRQQAERHVQCCCRQGTGLRRQKERNASGYRHSYRRTGYFQRTRTGTERCQDGTARTCEDPSRFRRKTLSSLTASETRKTSQDRVAQIKQQIAETKSDFDKEKLQERLAKLSGGVAVIRVGALPKPK
jgi:chaperonin GroEL